MADIFFPGILAAMSTQPRLPRFEAILAVIGLVVLGIGLVSHTPMMSVIGIVTAVLCGLAALIAYPLSRLSSTANAVALAVGVALCGWGIWYSFEYPNEPEFFSPFSLVFVAGPVAIACLLNLAHAALRRGSAHRDG